MIQSLLLFVWLALCAVQDIRQRQIANHLTLGGLLLAWVYVLWNGTTWLGAPAADGGWALGLALLFTLPGYALGRLGGADVKLLAALALATDSHYLMGTFVGAGVATGAWLLLAPKLWPLMNQGVRNALHYLQPQVSNKQPFAPFLFVGFSLTWVWIH
ncbi:MULTISPECIES: prepilin peptidase [unclassified Pseudomonas]|uniref:prepilin peptidase n=1 Tax=unclassified Pseudomonas TaxID=196821 RepID=UPI00069EF43B|nr:prepilin peptidase [Pseudomonas sp. MIACH]MBY8948579.1 prepilin peptidase [Pseudomonas sp. SH10-3B]